MTVDQVENQVDEAVGMFSKWSERPFGATCFVTGILAVLILLGRQVALDDLWGTPPLMLSIPFVSIATILAIVSIFRRERSLEHSLCGVGLAVAGIFLGWVLAGALALLFLWVFIQIVDILD